MKYIIVMIIVLNLIGCYGNWGSLDKVSQTISCDMNHEALATVANKYHADSAFDITSNSYSIVKEDDAIAVTFNSKGKIELVVKTKSMIALGGLIRKQGEVIVVKRCNKKNG